MKIPPRKIFADVGGAVAERAEADEGYRPCTDAGA